jgi:hypothetical protein
LAQEQVFCAKKIRRETLRISVLDDTNGRFPDFPTPALPGSGSRVQRFVLRHLSRMYPAPRTLNSISETRGGCQARIAGFMASVPLAGDLTCDEIYGSIKKSYTIAPKWELFLRKYKWQQLMKRQSTSQNFCLSIT